MNTKECVRTLTGHRNEKNFVGLSTCGDYIACGSDTNSLYIYYKDLTSPVIAHNFGGAQLEVRDRDVV